MSSKSIRTPEVRLRHVREDDLETLYEMQAAPGWTEMAGIPRRDRAAFFAHRGRTAADPAVLTRAIEVDGRLAGEALSFLVDDGRRVIGYGVRRELWGRGIASAALRTLLALVPERPIHATVSPENAGSRRVLERNGFVLTDAEPSPHEDTVLYVLR